MPHEFVTPVKQVAWGARIRLLSRILSSLTLRAAWNRLRAVPALGRFLRLLARRVLPPGPVWVVLEKGPLRGKQFLCDPRAHVGYVRGDHEPWTVGWLSELLRRGGTFVDVGAHLGYFTLIAADIVGPEGRVLAFEPDPRNAAILEANVAVAGIGSRVTVVKAAVGTEDGTTAFLHDQDFRSRVPRCGHVPGTRSVRQTCLDGWALPLGSVVKVDAEGAEMDVLLGACRHLMKKGTTWIIEVHATDMVPALLQLLRSFGYEPKVHALVHPAYGEHQERYIVAIGARSSLRGS